MKIFVFLLAVLLANAQVPVSTQVEWYSLAGHVADQCVNKERLSNLRPDCLESSKIAYPGTTLIVASASTPVGRRNSEIGPNAVVGYAEITGKFFGAAGVLQCFALANAATPDSCKTVDGLTLIEQNTGAFSFADPVLKINTIPASWTTAAIEAETVPRALCWSQSCSTGMQYQWTGFRVTAEWNCDDKADNVIYHCPQNKVNNTFTNALVAGRTKCCSGSTNVQATLRANQCINPNTDSCCGGTSVKPSMKCCNESYETVAWMDGTCPCRRQEGIAMCPNNELCCLQSKFSELVQSTDIGDCYNPAYARCCDTGKRYDPGSQQCCSINGLQTLNVPCPCSQTSDCLGGQASQGYAHIDFECCQQTAPAPSAATLQATTCNKYMNYPTGYGLNTAQRCLGHCIDTKYQICCNGKSCIREFEKCCNATCCNRFNGTCQSGALLAVSSASNWVEYGVSYDVCSTIEQIDLIKAWWMFVMPTFMLIATLGGLALSLVFAGRVEHKARRGLEKGMIGIAAVAVLFACPMYFAPIYKYGCVIAFASLFAIITAAARKINMYISCIIVQLILILYIIDPFNGNDYLNLAVDRNQFGRPEPMAAGLWHSTTRIWDRHDSCWNFYNGYFRFDPLLRDGTRFDVNTNPAFGYCSRGWVAALLVFDGIAISAVCLQFVLDVIVLLVRGRKLAEKLE